MTYSVNIINHKNYVFYDIINLVNARNNFFKLNKEGANYEY